MNISPKIDWSDICGMIYVIGYFVSLPIIAIDLWKTTPPRTVAELICFMVFVAFLGAGWPIVLFIMLMMYLNTIPLWS